jgi:hypothetical protein
MFKALKYPTNNGNFCRVDMIDVIVKEEFEKLSVDDPIDRLITYPADKEFESFLEQMELEISKSEEKRHETAEPAKNSQNCGPKEIFADRKKCTNGGRKFQSQNCGPKSEVRNLRSTILPSYHIFNSRRFRLDPKPSKLTQGRVKTSTIHSKG